MTIDERLDKFLSKSPSIDTDAYVAEQATVIGDVTLSPNSSVWPSAVLRGDINSISVGEASNIQDGVIVHLSDDFPVIIGNYVTIGHGAVIHACTIEDECLIGMNATILDGAIIGKNSIIGANSLVTSGTIIPEGSLVVGAPAKVIKTLSNEKQASIKSWAEKYIHVAKAHKNQ